MAGDIRAQVVAFPGTPYRRLKAELEAFRRGEILKDIELRFVQSRSDYVASIGKHEVLEISANVQDGYVHIAVLPTRDFRALEVFELDCRLVKLDVPGSYHDVTVTHVQDALVRALEYERRWCQVVRPVDWHTPLWLPPPSFEVERELQGYWKACDCYRRPEGIAHAHDLIQQVTARHKRALRGVGPFWIDRGSRQFKIDRSLHGMTREEREGKRRYRFAREVPVGFHYDVTHAQEGKRFTICSQSQVLESCGRVNVNPWGHMVVKS